jgi:hypothetical protein
MPVLLWKREAGVGAFFTSLIFVAPTITFFFDFSREQIGLLTHRRPEQFPAQITS